MTFQTMYLGVSPFASPAVYGLLPFTELGVGIWFPKGGLYAIPLALEKVAREEGVRLHYGAPVERILTEGARATGVRLADGRVVQADVVLCNADLPYAYQKLLDGAPTSLPRKEKLRYTSSGYMLYLGLQASSTRGWATTTWCSAGTTRARSTTSSSASACRRIRASTSTCPRARTRSLAPAGQDALYVLVPVPHQHPDLDWKVEGPKVRAKVFQRLAELGYPELEQDIEVERVFTPDDWASSYNLMHGSAFGLAQNFFQIGPFRPTNQDARVKNLFFVGASTQPGTGLPTVLISARLVAERVLGWAKQAGVAQRVCGAGRSRPPVEVAA